MKKLLVTLFIILQNNFSFSQNKTKNKWFLKLNNHLIVENYNFYDYNLNQNSSIPSLKIKSIEYTFNPSIMKITSRKNLWEIGINSLGIEKVNSKFDASWGHIQNTAINIDSTHRIFGNNVKDFNIGLLNGFHFNLLKKSSKKLFFSIGIQNVLSYYNSKYSPYVVNSFYRKVNGLSLVVGIAHKGGFYFNDKFLIEYTIPFWVAGTGIVREFVDNPQVSIKHRNHTNFYFETPDSAFYIPKQFTISVGCKL